MKTIRIISACLIALGITKAIKLELQYRRDKALLEWEMNRCQTLYAVAAGRNLNDA